MNRHLCLALVVIFGTQQSAWALELPLHPSQLDPQVATFLNRYCAECHGATKPKGDFPIGQLKASTNQADAENWQLVLDNLQLGEMPPKDARHPKSGEVEKVTTWNSQPPAPFAPDEIITNLRGVCDLTHLAFKTDSTRVITFGYFRQDTVAVPGVTIGYHNLSQHGQDEGNIAQLKRVERAFFDELKTLLSNLTNTREGDSALLDRTTIVVTSNLGSGNSHSNKDLPVLLAGGRFRHGQHLAIAPGTVPLSNLYVSVLDQLSFEDPSFGTSTGRLPGLEIV